ncbi:MAG: 3-deoxy-7-phosphoheptulonate synthase, partial [Candidatus Methylomirabilia bacterium]
VLTPGATQTEIDHVIEKIEAAGCKPHLSRGVERTIIGAIGDEAALRLVPLEILPGVDQVMPIQKPYKMVSREFKPEPSVIGTGGVMLGGKRLHVMAGPCAVENREMLIGIARQVKAAGATVLRGGAFKPRTSPYAFQGLEAEGVRYLAEAREETGLLVATELMDPRDLELLDRNVDFIQIGARNMQNFRLLKECGSVSKPIILKRGLSATIKDLLLSAEYIVANGNPNVILCERGIRTFEDYTRNTLDIAAVPAIKTLSHLPVIVDPSHAGGRRDLVRPLSLAALAAGADGLMIEVHHNPEEAFSDGPQSLRPEGFATLMEELRRLAAFLGREL